MYIGNSRTMERQLVPRTGIQCFFFPMASPRTPRGIALLALATARSLAVLLRFRPHATLATGGYVSAPVTLASWLLRIPIVLFLPDVTPGRAVRWLAPLTRRIAVATDGSLAYLPPGKTVITGYPVRDEFLSCSRQPARQRFDIPEDARVLCVFGGSQGSRAINTALAAALPQLLNRYWVLHICGEQRLPEAQAASSPLADPLRARYLLFPYLHGAEMADALAASDLALCRSGASTLGELPLTGTPAILVPLPQRGVHQQENAEYLTAAGAAVSLEDDQLATNLTGIVESILDDPLRLQAMSDACRALARPDAAEQIARVVAGVAV